MRACGGRGAEAQGRVDKAVAILNKCEVWSPTDLEHCCMLHVEKGAEASISAGLYGFLARAIDKATKDGAANAQPGNDMIKVLVVRRMIRRMSMWTSRQSSKLCK